MKIINTKTNLLKKLLYTLISLNSNIFGMNNQPIEEIEESDIEESDIEENNDDRKKALYIETKKYEAVLKEQMYYRFFAMDRSLSRIEFIYVTIINNIMINEEESFEIKYMIKMFTKIICFFLSLDCDEYRNKTNNCLIEKYDIFLNKEAFNMIIENINIIYNVVITNEKAFKKLIADSFKKLIADSTEGITLNIFPKYAIFQIYRDIQGFLTMIEYYMEFRDSYLNERLLITSKTLKSKTLKLKNLKLKRFTLKDFKLKNFKLQDLESKDLKSKDLESEDLESEDLESEDLESKDLESKDLESEKLEDLESEKLEDLKSKDLESEKLEDLKLKLDLPSECLQLEHLKLYLEVKKYQKLLKIINNCRKRIKDIKKKIERNLKNFKELNLEELNLAEFFQEKEAKLEEEKEQIQQAKDKEIVKEEDNFDKCVSDFREKKYKEEPFIRILEESNLAEFFQEKEAKLEEEKEQIQQAKDKEIVKEEENFEKCVSDFREKKYKEEALIQSLEESNLAEFFEEEKETINTYNKKNDILHTIFTTLLKA